MSFLDRIAKAAARHAPEDLAPVEDLAPSSKPAARVDPNAEPPSSHRKRKRARTSTDSRTSRKTAREPCSDADDEPCPAWIMARARTDWNADDPDDYAGRRAPPWPADVLPLVERLQGGPLALAVEDLPPAPWKLQPWATITDSAQWLDGLRREVELGTRGPRARMGSLQEDLRGLALAIRGNATADELDAARRGPSFG